MKYPRHTSFLLALFSAMIDLPFSDNLRRIQPDPTPPVVFSSITVACHHLPPGYRIRVGCATARERDGTARLNFASHVFPFPTLEVLAPEGSVKAEIRPTGGVWGGDAYRYTPTLLDRLKSLLLKLSRKGSR